MQSYFNTGEITVVRRIRKSGWENGRLDKKWWEDNGETDLSLQCVMASMGQLVCDDLGMEYRWETFCPGSSMRGAANVILQGATGDYRGCKRWHRSQLDLLVGCCGALWPCQPRN
jgi:hypothetical protein